MPVCIQLSLKEAKTLKLIVLAGGERAKKQLTKDFFESVYMAIEIGLDAEEEAQP
jgi:hypothetical protein